MIEQKRAVIYCRVSTKEQVEEGNSLVTQEKLCREYALKHGYEVSEAFIEQGESAKTADRAELRRLLDFCTDKRNQIKIVIAYKIDRISRNTDDYSQIRIVLKRCGVEIKSTSEHFETTTPAGKFMENIIANVAQFDNDVRTERSIGGMKDAMREGRYVWAAPIGYANVRINGKATITLTPMATLVRKAFFEIAKGVKSPEEVRRQLIEEGIRTVKGKSLSKSQFYYMLRNELYAGWILKFGERHKGLFEPILEQGVFDLVQKTLKCRARRNLYYLTEREDFPLRRFICNSDGLKLTGCWSKGRKKSYAYYFFRNKGGRFPTEYLNENFKSFLNSFRLDNKHVEHLKRKIYENFSKVYSETIDRKDELQKELLNLRMKQDILIEKNLKGIITDAILRQQLELIDQSQINVSREIMNLPDVSDHYEKLLETVEEFLKEPGTTWQRAPFPANLKLQRFYFPKGVTFDGTKCRTSEICNTFKTERIFFGPLSYKAPPIDAISNNLDLSKNFTEQTPDDPQDSTNTGNTPEDGFLNDVVRDIKFLANLKREMGERNDAG